MSGMQRLVTAGAICLGLAAFLTAAGVAASPNPKIVAEVPASIKAKGTLIVASDATYAPMEFIATNGQTVVGADADLATAIGQVLGLKLKVVNASFDTII